MQKQKRYRSMDKDPWRLAGLYAQTPARELFAKIDEAARELDSSLSRLPKAKRVRLSKKMLNITDKVKELDEDMARWEKEYKGFATKVCSLTYFRSNFRTLGAN